MSSPGGDILATYTSPPHYFILVGMTGINGLTLLLVLIVIGLIFRPHQTIIYLIIALALVGALTLIFNVITH